MTATGGLEGQRDPAGEAAPVGEPSREPIMMSLYEEYYLLIWQRMKTYEFRKRFLEGRATRWYVFLNAPVSRLTAVVDLDPAVTGTPEEIAEIAERMRAGNGASVLAYVQGLERAYAIPIVRAVEYPGLSIEELRAELGQFHPPQGYVRLKDHPDLLAVCEKVTVASPIRSITLDNRLCRFHCTYRRSRPARCAVTGWQASQAAPGTGQQRLAPERR